MRVTLLKSFHYFLLHQVAPSTSLIAIFCAFLYALHASNVFTEKKICGCSFRNCWQQFQIRCSIKCCTWVLMNLLVFLPVSQMSLSVLVICTTIAIDIWPVKNLQCCVNVSLMSLW